MLSPVWLSCCTTRSLWYDLLLSGSGQSRCASRSLWYELYTPLLVSEVGLMKIGPHNDYGIEQVTRRITCVCLSHRGDRDLTG